MSRNRCRRFRVSRGSVRDSKYEPIDSTATRLVAMRHRDFVGPSPPEPDSGNVARTATHGVERRHAARKSTQLPQLCALAVHHGAEQTIVYRATYILGRGRCNNRECGLLGTISRTTRRGPSR